MCVAPNQTTPELLANFSCGVLKAGDVVIGSGVTRATIFVAKELFRQEGGTEHTSTQPRMVNDRRASVLPLLQPAPAPASF